MAEAPAVAIPVPEPASPVPPVPAEQAMGDLFRTYQAGSPDDPYVPAYIRGFKPSEDAVKAWQAANHPITAANLDEFRMPETFKGGPQPMSGGNWPYGGPMPMNLTFGDKRGQVDPEALRVMAQGGKYDVEGRRAAIAARITANALANTEANRLYPQPEYPPQRLW